MPTHIFTDEEKENLREQMLEAGFPLLKQYGMTHTSVAKITQAAGIAVGTFYSFWKNKEAYMADLIGYHRRKLMPVLMYKAQQSGKPEEMRSLHMMDCIECGCCAYTCPAGVPLVLAFRSGKQILRSAQAAKK